MRGEEEASFLPDEAEPSSSPFEVAPPPPVAELTPLAVYMEETLAAAATFANRPATTT